MTSSDNHDSLSSVNHYPSRSYSQHASGAVALSHRSCHPCSSGNVAGDSRRSIESSLFNISGFSTAPAKSQNGHSSDEGQLSCRFGDFCGFWPWPRSLFPPIGICSTGCILTTSVAGSGEASGRVDCHRRQTSSWLVWQASKMSRMVSVSRPGIISRRRINCEGNSCWKKLINCAGPVRS